MMVSIKQATESAIAFAREILGPERVGGLRLEEVESTKTAGVMAWVITLSMADTSSPLSVVSGKRHYKSFTVRKADGEVLSMKIRELADA
jgi:hypothetical protein